MFITLKRSLYIRCDYSLNQGDIIPLGIIKVTLFSWYNNI